MKKNIKKQKRKESKASGKNQKSIVRYVKSKLKNNKRIDLAAS
jgi:hypothetical protein